MKAEHRKELHTNALASQMNKLVQGVRSNSRSTSAVAWALGIVTVGVIVAWWASSGSGANRSAVWQDLYEDTQLKSLEGIAEANKGTIPGRMADFQRARILLQEGVEGIYSFHRTDAIKNLQEARKLYNQLRPESASSPPLTQETLLGAAKAEEALVGVPVNDDKPDEGYQGDLTKAIDLYKQYLTSLAKTDPDSKLYIDINKHVKELEADPDKVVEFYKSMNRIASKPKMNEVEKSLGQSQP